MYTSGFLFLSLAVFAATAAPCATNVGVGCNNIGVYGPTVSETVVTPFHRTDAVTSPCGQSYVRTVAPVASFGGNFLGAGAGVYPAVVRGGVVGTAAGLYPTVVGGGFVGTATGVVGNGLIGNGVYGYQGVGGLAGAGILGSGVLGGAGTGVVV